MDAGADIISMSLGSPTEAPIALHEKIKEATNKGIIVLAAAGNDAGIIGPSNNPFNVGVCVGKRFDAFRDVFRRAPRTNLRPEQFKSGEDWMSMAVAHARGEQPQFRPVPRQGL